MESLKQGFVFVCSKATLDDCFKRMLFGSTLAYKDEVLKIKKGDTGFLYNKDTDVLFGVFEAVSDGSLDIEPRALRGNFPAQVKVAWMKKYQPVEDARSVFRKLGIKFGSFWLTPQQLDNLRSVFERVPASEEDFRKEYPRKYRTQDGHYVRTKSEAIIDDWLYSHNIVHAYERKLPIEEDMYCDFFIPKGKCYIEYWGIENEEYLNRKKKKCELYRRHELNLIELTEKDIEHIDDVLPKKLRQFLPAQFKID